ncbi:hypothetical protein RUND412_000601 [Rhizina undulata]
MFGGSKKPYSAVSVHVERLTTEEYDEHDLSGIPELIEVIKIQDSGPTEVSRAIRKKLKYGNVHRQLRALTILDALIGNAGVRFQRSFADEPLLERLRITATDSMTDPDVKAKLKVLFGQWAVAYKNTQGCSGIANLYKQLPQRRRPKPEPQALREASPEVEKEPRSPTSPRQGPAMASSSRSYVQPVTLGTAPNFGSTHKKTSSKSKSKAPPFNLEKEKPAMLQALANSSVASTNLTNALKLINREKERPSDNQEVLRRFETCKQLRRSILRYIQNVESEQWLGGLIHANEELIEALTLYEALDKPIEQDSDSDDEGWNDPPSTNSSRLDLEKLETGVGRMTMRHRAAEDLEDERPPPMPPRPGTQAAKGKDAWYESGEEEEEEDPDDPFSNKYRIDETL